MFVTQRGWLYAIPAGLVLLWHWREKFFRQGPVASQPLNAPAGDVGLAASAEATATNETAAPRLKGPLPFCIELSLYDGIPHLYDPKTPCNQVQVITMAKQAAASLKAGCPSART